MAVKTKIDFKKIAEESTQKSFLQEGREKIKTTEAVALFPDGMEIVNFDIVEYVAEDKPVRYAAFAVKAPNDTAEYYYEAGIVLTKIVDSWIDVAGGDIELARKMYADADRVVVKLEETKTANSKNSLTKVTIL